MTAHRQALIVVAALIAIAFGFLFGGAVPTASAQTISVTEAVPPTGEQGAFNLPVTIKGKGFKNGAQVKFYKGGTSDPSFINVKSTKFVSSTELLATIDIADLEAALGGFDIEVAVAGRTGKGTELFSVVAKGSGSWSKQDVELAVDFNCVAGQEGWCGDGYGAYQSDGGSVLAKIEFVDYDENGTGGGFALEVGSNSARAVSFNFGTPLPAPPGGTWCPERCPGTPDEAPPDFSIEPIRLAWARTVFGYSPPNYDFLDPTVCDYNGDGKSDWMNDDGTGTPYCVTDALIRIETAKSIYRLRVSPNVWRTFAPNTTPYGAMKVRYFAAFNQWTLEPLLSYDFAGDIGLKQEPCPAVLERRVLSHGRVTYKFVGCDDLPFLLTLTKR